MLLNPQTLQDLEMLQKDCNSLLLNVQLKIPSILNRPRPQLLISRNLIDFILHHMMINWEGLINHYIKDNLATLFPPHLIIGLVTVPFLYKLMVAAFVQWLSACPSFLERNTSHEKLSLLLLVLGGGGEGQQGHDQPVHPDRRGWAQRGGRGFHKLSCLEISVIS